MSRRTHKPFAKLDVFALNHFGITNREPPVQILFGIVNEKDRKDLVIDKLTAEFRNLFEQLIQRMNAVDFTADLRHKRQNLFLAIVLDPFRFGGI